MYLLIVIENLEVVDQKNKAIKLSVKLLLKHSKIIQINSELKPGQLLHVWIGLPKQNVLSNCWKKYSDGICLISKGILVCCHTMELPAA